MRLTQAGEALVRHAAGILAGLTAAEEEVAAIAGLRAGRVRLVSFPSGSSTLVPTALAALRAAHPGTRVSLEEAEPPHSVELLREGDCDWRWPSGTRVRRAPGGMGRPGGPPLAHAIGSSGSCPKGTGWPVRSRSPSGTRRGALDRRLPALSGQLVEVCESAGFTPRIDFATDDYPAVVGLVGAGLGVAVLPELAIESVRPEGCAW